MKTHLVRHAALTTAILALAAWVAPPAQAVTLTAGALAQSGQPTPLPNMQNLQNGDFLVIANPQNAPGQLTGDGIDEETRWRFNFNGQPQLGAFLAEGGVASAVLSITIGTSYFFDGIGPPGAVTRPSDGIGGLFPIWNLSNQMTGTFGVYSRATFSTDLVNNLGMSGSEISQWLATNNGFFPMVFIDDAIVVESTLTLVSAPVPEPGSAALMLAGLAAAGSLVRRRQSLGSTAVAASRPRLVP